MLRIPFCRSQIVTVCVRSGPQVNIIMTAYLKMAQASGMSNYPVVIYLGQVYRR